MPAKNNKNSRSTKNNKQSKINKFLFKKSQLLLLTAVLILFSAISLAITAINFLQPVDPQDQSIVRVVIPKGRSVKAVSQQLKEKGLIKSPFMFQVYYRLNQDQYKIQAGSFELSPSLAVEDIFQKLSQGTDDVWITLTEGLRREEIAESLESYSLQEYDQQEFLSQTVGLEGQLFPDTYLVPKESTTQSIVSLLQNTFEEKIEPLQAEIDQSPRSFKDLLIMASLLEREAQGKEQMRLVSGVLWKRLELGMPLQVDATLQYAKGYDEQLQTWWPSPTAGDKEIDSRFNTYRNPGLPPHPICNPGYDAIEAALTPIDSGNLYYLHDNQGEIHFAQTLQEHNQNVNRYLR